MPTATAIYIYGLADPQSGALRYIGKATDPKRRLREHHSRCGNPHLANWLIQLRRLGLKPDLRLLSVVSPDIWQESERMWIRLARERGDNLVNLNPGGEGQPAGKPFVGQRRIGPMPEEQKQKISATLKGRVFTEEHRERLSSARQRQSPPMLGHTSWNKGMKMSEEYCAKLSAAHAAKKRGRQ